MPHRAIFSTLSLLVACGSQDSDSTTTNAEEPSVAELAACDEHDLELIPFMGPAFDDNGALLAPLPVPHIVATTAGWHTPENRDAVVSHNAPPMMDVFTHDGLLGASFAYSEACRSARTVTLWRDEAARKKFVFGEVHSAAIKNGLKYTSGWETTHWTESTATEPPSWDALKVRLATARGE